MTDISNVLNMIMHDKKCSSVYAFYLLGGAHDKSDDEPAVSLYKPVRSTSRDEQHKLGTGDRGGKSIHSYAKRECNSYGQRG